MVKHIARVDSKFRLNKKRNEVRDEAEDIDFNDPDRRRTTIEWIDVFISSLAHISRNSDNRMVFADGLCFIHPNA